MPEQKQKECICSRHEDGEQPLSFEEMQGAINKMRGVSELMQGSLCQPQPAKGWEDELLEEFPLLKIQHGGRDKIVTFIRKQLSLSRHSTIEDVVRVIEGMKIMGKFNPHTDDRYQQDFVNQALTDLISKLKNL